MTPLLRIENAAVEFYARKRLLSTVVIRALDGVSIHLGWNETLAVVGESGSGKTTLGRVCLRLLKPTSGTVTFDGGDITNVTEKGLKNFRQRAQGIFQDPFSSMDPYMTVGQIAEEPLVIHGMGHRNERQQIVYGALEEVKLSPAREMAAKFPHMLSGGQRQRVAIARALVMEPDLVVADEPVSMVDASSRAMILNLLQDLQVRLGTAFLYITHDIATASYFSHRIAVMYLGRIVETGPTREVIASPLHPYTWMLLNSVPNADADNRFRRRSVVTGEPPSPANPPTGCHFHPRCPYALARCSSEVPGLQEVRSGQWVACHLWAGPDPEARLPQKPTVQVEQE